MYSFNIFSSVLWRYVLIFVLPGSHLIGEKIRSCSFNLSKLLMLHYHQQGMSLKKPTLAICVFALKHNQSPFCSTKAAFLFCARLNAEVVLKSLPYTNPYFSFPVYTLIHPRAKENYWIIQSVPLHSSGQLLSSRYFILQEIQ